LILVTAANGKTGRAMVSALVEAGAGVRAFIRDPSQIDGLHALGAAETAVGDLGDAASLQRAMAGANQVLHIGPPMDPNEVVYTNNVINAAKEAGVEQFVYYSVMHPQRRVIRHHRLKLEAEEYVIESGLPYTIVEPIRYMQHLVPIWRRVVDEGVHAMPFSIERKFNVADLADLAAATAKVLLDPAHLYATYELAGPEALSQSDMAAIISAVIGRPVRAEAVPLAALEDKGRAAGLSEDRIQQMAIMNGHYDSHGFLGSPVTLRGLLGREPTTFESYVKRLQTEQSTR
jgi:uncharacterized protein YbjT (DUF2867 family)